MIDFQKLVLGPCVNILGQTAILNPVQSSPGTTPYAFRAIWTNRTIEVSEGNTNYRTENRPALGAFAAVFATIPQVNDLVTTNGFDYQVVDVKLDGQGGIDLSLKLLTGHTTVIAAPTTQSINTIPNTTSDSGCTCTDGKSCWFCRARN